MLVSIDPDSCARVVDFVHECLGRQRTSIRVDGGAGSVGGSLAIVSRLALELLPDSTAKRLRVDAKPRVCKGALTARAHAFRAYRTPGSCTASAPVSGLSGTPVVTAWGQFNRHFVARCRVDDSALSEIALELHDHRR